MKDQGTRQRHYYFPNSTVGITVSRKIPEKHR